MLMKTKYLHLITLFMILFSGCKEGDKFKDVLYFTGTEDSPVSKYSIDGPTEIGVTISSSALSTNDKTVTIKVDPSLLEAYNEENGKKYQMIPTDNFQLSSDKMTFKKGQNVSDPVIFSLLNTTNLEEGVTYCVPMTIVNVSDGMSVLETSKTIFLVLEQIIITKAANLKGSAYYTVPFKNDNNLSSLPQCSMETRLYMHSFQKRNPYISSVIGIEENFLLRFGDVNIDPNQIQLSGGGYQVTGSTMFETNKWYHVAVVYDGSEIRLYVNGKLDGSTAAPRGNINLADTYSGGFHIGYSAGGRLLNGTISEVRVWKKALTPNEILNNMCYLSPDNFKDLIAYWRLNDGSTAIKDWSGNGWDLTSGGSVEWVEGVKCPE